MVISPTSYTVWIGFTLLPVTERSPYPCQQLANAERLVHIVIGAKIECLDLLGLSISGRKDDDRNLRPLPDLPDDLLSILVRQSEIKEHRIG